MRWRTRFGVALALVSVLAACGRSRESVSGGSGAGARAGSGSGGSTGSNDGGAPDTGATGGDGTSTSARGGGAGAGASAQGGGAGSTASGAGLGATAGETGSTEAPDRDDHTPTSVVPECLQPKVPSGSVELPQDVHVGTTWLRSSERDCNWTVGTPVDLPLEPDDAGELLFQIDVNGDHIDDLIFGSHSAGTVTATGQSLVLLESSYEDGELTYARTSCGTPWDISYRSFYARDLDRDGEPDFVLGGVNEISAVLNHAGERPEVLHYAWPPGKSSDAWVSVLDVAVGDFDADGRDDIAIGYDRATGANMSTIETGVLLFRDRSAAGTYGAPDALAIVSVDLLSSVQTFGLGWPAGLLASVPGEGDASTLFSLYMTGSSDTGFKYEGGKLGSFLAPSVSFAQPIFARSTMLGEQSVLAIAGRDALEMVQPTAPYDHVAGVTLAFSHPDDHELGGGTRIRSVFLLDLDGDGDEDLLERGSKDGWPPWAFWSRNRTSDAAFDAPVQLQDVHESSRSLESPFVRAGVFPGRLFVSDGTPPKLWPIACSGG